MSSDADEAQRQGPMPSAEWLAAHRLRVVADDDAREEREQHSWLDEINGIARRAIARWQATSCGGERARIGECSDQNAQTCDLRRHDECPRNLAESARIAGELQRAERREFLRKQGLPERVLQVVYDYDGEWTEAVGLLDKAMQAQPQPVITVLSGGVGCGKSCAAGWWAVTKGARWVSVREFAKVSPYDDEAKRIAAVPFLVLDDLGAEYLDAKGFFLAHLDGLIDHRYANLLPTVITTNLPLDPPRDQPGATCFRRYGERVIDRMRESGRWIDVSGKSLRRKP